MSSRRLFFLSFSFSLSLRRLHQTDFAKRTDGDKGRDKSKLRLFRIISPLLPDRFQTFAFADQKLNDTSFLPMAHVQKWNS
jgi:hypothetical protein